jgi:hypothetical protein
MGRELLAVKEFLLGQLSRGEKFDAEKLVEFRTACEAASHDGPCPCGSDRKFADCCKLDWVMLRDQFRVAEEAPLKAEAVEVKGNGEDKEPSPKDVKWLCRVGVMGNGSIAVEQTPDAVGTPPIRIAELLIGAYHVVNFNATIGTMQAIIQRERPIKGPSLRSAFKG